jgi:hypothetical protein
MMRLDERRALTTGDMKYFCLNCIAMSCNRIKCGAPGTHRPSGKFASNIVRDGQVVGRIVEDNGRFVIDEFRYGMFVEIDDCGSRDDAWLFALGKWSESCIDWMNQTT